MKKYKDVILKKEFKILVLIWDGYFELPDDNIL